LHYETEKGTEIWPDIPSLLTGTMGKGKYPGIWGDCLPLSTLVLRDDFKTIPISKIEVGNRIMGRTAWTTILDHAMTGEKKILAFSLSNHRTLRCSPEHRLFLVENEREIRARNVRRGMSLLSPGEFPGQSHLGRSKVFSEGVIVEEVSEAGTELCYDITTDTGRFWLPESDLIVHNCEDLACYRVAELRELPWHYTRPLPSDKTKTEHADPRFPQTAMPAPIPTTSGKKAAPALKTAPASEKNWSGWKKVKGGIKAKPFAKWRRGPAGNYHYHAIVLLPDGRLEDPSLVLGMGREKQFADENMAEKFKSGAPVALQFAKAPEVMVVDPEKPSGYAGGKAMKLDAKIVELLKKGMAPEDVAITLGDVELGSYLSNEIPLGEGEFDVDKVIGWDRESKSFGVKDDNSETRRLFGYAKH
jgi:hypothetical protein